MERLGKDGGCKNCAAENQRGFPFYTNNDNDHLINMPYFDWVRKWVRITVKLQPKRQIDLGLKNDTAI